MKSLPLILALLLPATAYAQKKGFKVDQSFFKDPKFIESFVGSYGALPQVEPKVSEEENQLLADMDLLQSKVGEELAAAPAVDSPETTVRLPLLLLPLPLPVRLPLLHGPYLRLQLPEMGSLESYVLVSTRCSSPKRSSSSVRLLRSFKRCQYRRFPSQTQPFCQRTLCAPPLSARGY